jgi:chloramphenicol 3-O phosphotransferase
VNQGKIIFLNGASSSGKSTIAKLLQDRLDEPFLHMQLDSFLQMLPHINDDLVMKMAPGFHQSVAAMAGAGNNIIVDHVLVADEWLEECVRILTGYVLFVGLRCPLTELERRESERDARRQGFARAQFEIVHAGKSYDVELDTSLLTPVECMQKVMSFYSDRKPTAFLRMRQSLIPGQPAGSGDAL